MRVKSVPGRSTELPYENGAQGTRPCSPAPPCAGGLGCAHARCADAPSAVKHGSAHTVAARRLHAPSGAKQGPALAAPPFSMPSMHLRQACARAAGARGRRACVRSSAAARKRARAARCGGARERRRLTKVRAAQGRAAPGRPPASWPWTGTRSSGAPPRSARASPCCPPRCLWQRGGGGAGEPPAPQARSKGEGSSTRRKGAACRPNRLRGARARARARL